MNQSTSHYLQNWIPFKIFYKDGQPLCQWLHIDDRNFTEPFFEETISGYRHTEFNSKRTKCTSSIDMLPEWADQIKSIPPSAFIFHVSRCGSTLASQLLALSDEHIVLSEVPFFDDILQLKNKDKAGSSQLLKAAIDLYGVKRNNTQSRVFIKTDSWHIFFYEQIRKAYPGVPVILLYRHPVEVIHSQQKKRGMQAVPGVIDPDLFGFTDSDIYTSDMDGYMAKVLEKYFQSFLTIARKDPLSVLVNYKEGAMTMIEKIAGITGLSFTDEELSKMTQRASYHAKYPGEVFQADKVVVEIPLYCTKAFELYQALEQLRVATEVTVAG